MRRRSLALVAAISMIVSTLLIPSAPAAQSSPIRRDRIAARVQYGSASWYGGAFHGRRTAYGERFDRTKMTLASRSLPYNTRVRITNLRNGKSCIARVTDYGPNGRCRSRIADLSEAAASAIGIKSSGVGKVKIEVFNPLAPQKRKWTKIKRTPPIKQLSRKTPLKEAPKLREDQAAHFFWR